MRMLQRHPQLVLVDELAHTNAEGSRHPKRYMDVEELLAAGIDVYTTLNIQHIESLNDVVAQITRIRVRETVPDESWTRPTKSNWSTLTADDLLQRLREGKVYVKAQAERALKHFFSPGNLTALRELALRRTAQHVDREVTDYMQAHAIGGPGGRERFWSASTKIPRSPNWSAARERIADGANAPWTALYIESARHLSLERARKGPRRRYAASGSSAWAPKRVDACRAATSRRRSWNTRARTMSPRSSSPSPNARAGSKSFMVRWCAI